MITFIVLGIILAIAAIIALISLIVGGGAFIVLFGDIIIFAMIMIGIIKLIFKKRKNKKR